MMLVACTGYPLGVSGVSRGEVPSEKSKKELKKTSQKPATKEAIQKPPARRKTANEDVS